MIKSRILVAEDDRYLAALIRQTLESHGFAITLAHNGEEALLKADMTCPDLVLLDVSMPVMDGLTALRSLRANRFHYRVPVLMLTAARSESDVRDALSNGASDYLVKPFRPDVLIRRVERLLGSIHNLTDGFDRFGQKIGSQSNVLILDDAPLAE